MKSLVQESEKYYYLIIIIIIITITIIIYCRTLYIMEINVFLHIRI